MNNKAKTKIILVIIVFVLLAMSNNFTPHNPVKQNLSIRLQPSSKEYPFGTDTLGRCVLSRVLAGGKLTIGIVILSSTMVLILGTVFGLINGLYSGKLEIVFESIINMFTALPPIIYILVFVGIWGGGAFTMILSLTLSNWARVAKLVKAKVDIEKNKAYVFCAITSGASRNRLIFVHILPNCIREILVFMSLICADMIILIASFSFIGIGLGSDTVNWGQMIAEGRSKVRIRPDIILYPAITIFLSTFLFNYIGKETD
ncbi:ABC transporter permease [Vallitalea guaymasensis]|uniref:ABC transporter permease subunit n=1 Tax=Vallitalea guaymasensis TaxID=1185412 RepID=A0A8J8MBJ3_9FIRM|nr:ABC transporter permease subunit [Vallitalea guaymasensis]QUH29809.1 ABC transporter permease subunit [Vallitalea guaymasensis]